MLVFVCNVMFVPDDINRLSEERICILIVAFTLYQPLSSVDVIIEIEGGVKSIFTSFASLHDI